MELTIEELVTRVALAARHLYEAGKYLSDVDQTFSLRYLTEADRLLSMIPKEDMPVDKMTNDQINSILSEIFSSEEP